ncbi:MAG: hypothetical protein COA94_03110 [Rickettsiales bacterium]|nr:MAG: hypothetical protein COA94_03110 [Rickettsiales bacterium]
MNFTFFKKKEPLFIKLTMDKFESNFSSTKEEKIDGIVTNTIYEFFISTCEIPKWKQCQQQKLYVKNTDLYPQILVFYDDKIKQCSVPYWESSTILTYQKNVKTIKVVLVFQSHYTKDVVACETDYRPEESSSDFV